MARATQPDLGFDDHLSGEENEGHEEEVVFERSTRSTTRAANDQAEELEEGGASDRDESLSAGDSYSSYGDASLFTGPPNLQRLVRLGPDHCRSPCRITNSAGVKVASVCGREVRECKRHADRRLRADNYQYTVGSYMPVNVSRGFAGHGLASGPHYTDAQIQAFQAEEAEEMTRQVDAMNEDMSDQEEMEELSRDVRVQFAPHTTSPAKEKASVESELYDLRKALAASSGGSSRKKSPSSPNLWFGMVGKQGVRWITSNSSEAYDTISKMHCRIAEIFLTRADAEAWMEKEASTPTPRIGHDQDSDNESSAPEVDEKVSAKAKRLRKKNQVRKARRQKEKKVSKAKVKQTPRKVDVRRPSKKGRHKSDDESDPSDSSDESSDESSQSDPSSSSSSDNSSSNSASSSNDSSARRPARRRSKKMSKKASKKHDKNRKKRKETNYYRFQHEDTSTGDSQRIYGMSINGTTIDKAVAPDSMRRTDRGAMYNASVDVTSLPGGWNSNKGVSEEMFQESQKIAQLTSTILASTSKIKGMEIQDTSWNSTIRHSLGRVKNREELFEFVKKLGKSKTAAFKQETNMIQQFMYHRQYGGKFIREYTRSSLLCLISARSFKSFYDLGNAIRQLAFDHANWESGPAKAMLSFHSEKLMEIRQFAVSRKQLILQIYTYLRDAQAKEFYHESMTGAIWERIANIPTTPASTAGGGSESSRCSYCTNKDMHKLFNVLGQRDLCPVRSLPNKAKAKDAAKWIVDQKRADSSKDIQTLLASALTQFV
jgi:hypothetical protein